MKKTDPGWGRAVTRFQFGFSGGRPSSCDVCNNRQDEPCSCSPHTEDRYMNPSELGYCPETGCAHNVDGICNHPWHPANTKLEDLVLEAL
jgi:hypothetical protein